jgi:hypothetical protein
MANEMPSYESILRYFRERRGLYILGAGVSVGAAPFGKGFWTEPTVNYLRNSRSFPVVVPVHSELTQRMIDHSRSLSMPEIFPDREMRYGSEDFHYRKYYLEYPIIGLAYTSKIAFQHSTSQAGKVRAMVFSSGFTRR